MPLSLNDQRWGELHSSYNGTEDVLDWLTRAYDMGDTSNELIGDVVNEIQHQGGTSTAMYAVAPHFIELARRVPPDRGMDLLISAGMIYASAGKSDAVECPDFLREEFIACASEGAKLLSNILLHATNFESYKWAVAALAGFLGHDRSARFLDGLEFYNGRFHHVRLDGPFPED
jgi:hypothetical protein